MSNNIDPYDELTIPPGTVAEPGTTLVNETGSWREERPVVKHEACTGCARCAIFCPDTCIHYVGGRPDAADHIARGRLPEPVAAKHVGDPKVLVDYTYCKGCGICAEECPIDAIRMVSEVK